MKKIKDFFVNPFVWSIIAFVVINIGLILIYFYCLIDENYKEIVKSIIIGITTALIITITIGVAERKRFEKFQKDTAKNAIKSLFTRLIHRKTFAMIQKDIFQGKFVRKNVTWKYDIKKKDENNKKMALTRIIQYALKNITQKTQKEKFYIYSDSTNIHCELTHTKIYIKQNGQKEWKEITEKKGKEYRIVKLKPNEELGVKLEMTESFNKKLDYIYATHSPRFSMVGLKLDVSFPEDYKFEIVVDAFSNKLQEIPSGIQGHCTYETKKAIYKGQAIEFVCYPKADKTNQSSVSQTNTNPKDTK